MKESPVTVIGKEKKDLPEKAIVAQLFDTTP